MKQYIERSELVSRIYKYVELTNPEEQEWVKDECIRQAHAMPSVNVGEWISVDERLPESLQRVLAINTRGDMFTSVYISFATGKNAWSTPYSYLGNVTHWMPLPEPPKGD